MKPVHPGRLLRRELQARDLSANALALALRVSSGRIAGILNGKRGVSPETAMRRFEAARANRHLTAFHAISHHVPAASVMSVSGAPTLK